MGFKVLILANSYFQIPEGLNPKCNGVQWSIAVRLLTPYLGKPFSTKIDVFFLHRRKGEGGWSPCLKIYVADLYNSGGLLAT